MQNLEILRLCTEKLNFNFAQDRLTGNLLTQVVKAPQLKVTKSFRFQHPGGYFSQNMLKQATADGWFFSLNQSG